jgi:glyoxylase-like metal-dependent hydrolase (beta-lactamase superfamily II)
MRTLAIRVTTGILLSGAVAATLVLPSRAQAPDFTKVNFKATRLAPNLHMLEGVGGFSGGNIAVVVAPDGVLLVDASMPPLSDKLRAAVKTISDQPIKAIVNTHSHGDHSMGNISFGKDAMIFAHPRTRERLASEGFGEWGKAPPQALPDVTVDDKLRVYWGDEELRVATTPPAHTDTDVTVQFVNGKVVHLGDLFFNGMFPFIDVERGGDVKGTIAAIEKALAALPADARIIPGHGPLATRKDLETYLATLKETSAIVEKAIAAGKTLDDLKKAKALGKYEKYSWQFVSTDQFTETLYASLKK